MTLEQEMKLWETRSNDKFGKFIRLVENVYLSIYCNEEDEYGIKSNPISHLATIYALDGNVKSIYQNLRTYIEDYELEDNENKLTFNVERFLKEA